MPEIGRRTIPHRHTRADRGSGRVVELLDGNRLQFKGDSKALACSHRSNNLERDERAPARLDKAAVPDLTHFNLQQPSDSYLR